jgi:hypothetical protein
MVEPQEVRPAKRTRTGLSVAEREAKAAFKLMKEKKRMEIYEFRMNYQGPPYHPIERCQLPPIDIVLKPDAAKAYRKAEAALAEAKEKNPDRSMDKDWICDDNSCPNLYRHAREESCKLKMEDMLPLTTMPAAPEIARQITYALESGWKYSGMRPYTGLYCLNNMEEC